MVAWKVLQHLFAGEQREITMCWWCQTQLCTDAAGAPIKDDTLAGFCSASITPSIPSCPIKRGMPLFQKPCMPFIFKMLTGSWGTPLSLSHCLMWTTQACTTAHLFKWIHHHVSCFPTTLTGVIFFTVAHICLFSVLACYPLGRYQTKPLRVVVCVWVCVWVCVGGEGGIWIIGGNLSGKKWLVYILFKKKENNHSNLDHCLRLLQCTWFGCVGKPLRHAGHAVLEDQV